MVYVLFVVATWYLTACATTSTRQPSFEKSRVIERIGNHEDAPDWSDGAKQLYLENNDIVFATTITMSGDARTEACTNAAADLGRVQILRQIKDQMTASGTIESDSASSDPIIESFVAFLSQGTISGVKISDRYWERREESNVNGQRVLRIHCAAKVAISKSQFDRQLRAALDELRPEQKQLKNKIYKAQKDFLDSLSDSSQSGSHAKSVDEAPSITSSDQKLDN